MVFGGGFFVVCLSLDVNDVDILVWMDVVVVLRKMVEELVWVIFFDIVVCVVFFLFCVFVLRVDWEELVVSLVKKECNDGVLGVLYDFGFVEDVVIFGFYLIVVMKVVLIWVFVWLILVIFMRFFLVFVFRLWGSGRVMFGDDFFLRVKIL